MPTIEHESAVRALCASDPLLHRFGFRQAVLAEWPEFELADELGIIPDAWKIMDGEVYCYEVSHTAGLTDRRRGVYGRLWFVLDSYDLTLRLIASDTAGASAEVDLAAWWGKYAEDANRL